MPNSSRLGFVPLSDIDYNPAINARRDTETDISELAATIDTSAIGQPLLLRPNGARFEPVDGGRRYRALKYLAAIGRIMADFPVPAMIRDLDDAEALTLSLQTAVTRLDLNPADEALSFADLVKAGRAPETIATIFGVPLRRVKQRLSIAALPPEIVAALRSGDIGIETAQAFTLGTDPKLVLKLFKESSGSHPNYIRTQLTAKRLSAFSREANFVGLAAYRAAGGFVHEDLFSNNQWLADAKLLTKLCDAKVKKWEKNLLAEGWSFVMIETEASYTGKTYGWPTLKPDVEPKLDNEQTARVKVLNAEIKALQKRLEKAEDKEADTDELSDALDALEFEHAALTASSFSPAQMQKSGVILHYQRDGIELRLGVMKPSAAKAKSSKQKPSPTPSSPGASRGAANTEPDEADFTGALQLEMAKAMTQAMQTAISTKPDHALRLMLAALGDALLGNEAFPVRVTARRDHLATPEPLRARAVEVCELLTTPAAEAFDVEDAVKSIAVLTAALFNLGASIPDAVRHLIDAFDPDVAAIWQPNEAFFKRLPKDSLAAALNEAAIPGVTAAKKKRELAEMALRDLVPLGWLPKPLRTPCYTGPGSNRWADAKSAQLADEIASAPDRHSGESRNPASQAAE